MTKAVQQLPSQRHGHNGAKANHEQGDPELAVGGPGTVLEGRESRSPCAPEKAETTESRKYLQAGMAGAIGEHLQTLPRPITKH